jgi:hypothetical protein
MKTFSHIVGFGDSWMWGDELLDPHMTRSNPHPIMIENTPYRESHCFLGLLGQHFGVPTTNFGWPGGSLQSAIWTYLWWLENSGIDPKQCLVLVALTDANRESYYNPNHVVYDNDPPWNRFIHSSWMHSGNPTKESKMWVDLIKLSTVLTDCEQTRWYNYFQTVHFFHGQSAVNNNNVLMFNSCKSDFVINLPELLWPEKSLSELMYQNSTNLLNLQAPNGHANELGHQVIRDLLINEIDCVIMT